MFAWSFELLSLFWISGRLRGSTLVAFGGEACGGCVGEAGDSFSSVDGTRNILRSLGSELTCSNKNNHVIIIEQYTNLDKNELKSLS